MKVDGDATSKPRRIWAAAKENIPLLVLALWVLAALIIPSIWGEYAFRQYVRASLLPPMSTGPDAFLHVFGTDPLGRDVLVRSFVGARVSLILAVSGVVVAGVVGLLAGTVAGYFRGWADTILGRLMDAQQALPTLAVALLAAVLIGPSTENVIVILAITGWVNYARVIRGEALALAGREFIEAARALGASHLRIVFKHMIPNLMPTAITIATVEVGRMVLLEASLSFLGFGIQPPTPSIGTMIRAAQTYIFTAPWLGLVPGLLLLVLVVAVNTTADSKLFRQRAG